MDIETLRRLNEARTNRRAAATIITVETAQAMLLIEGEPAFSQSGQAVHGALRSGRSGIIEINGHACFVNVYLPRPRIVVIGAVHITQALAGLAAIAGFALMVIDPRTAFATPKRFSGVDLVAEWPEDALASRPLDSYTALVAVTHDPKIDDGALKAAIDANCFYIGALGSRKTHATRVERLAGLGLDVEAIARISAPIGLDIGASSPAEIAVAILAEIIQVLRRRDPGIARKTSP